MASVHVVYRPLISWNGTLLTDDEREYGRFSATWEDTLDLLDREAYMLGAREMVVQLALSDSKIRRDGIPYADAKPSHPGVTIVLPETSQGRVSFSTDRYRRSAGYGVDKRTRNRVHRTLPGWQANVRAVALSMEALRAAERHGVTQGRQYAGFREIGSGGVEAERPKMTLDEAARFVAEQSESPIGGSVDRLAGFLLTDAGLVDFCYRLAAKRLHPDKDGGDSLLFTQLQAARELITSHQSG